LLRFIVLLLDLSASGRSFPTPGTPGVVVRAVAGPATSFRVSLVLLFVLVVQVVQVVQVVLSSRR
jgi:hypothetical protein